MIMTDYRNLQSENLENFLNAAAGAENMQAAEVIRDIADVLDIDKNIKKAMESLLRIAGRLEGGNGSDGNDIFTKGSSGKATNGRENG